MSFFLFKHKIDKSLLTDGFHISPEFHQMLFALLGRELKHGESCDIEILIDGEKFKARLHNINFDQTRYPNHPDLVQVRYSNATPIAKKLQSIFYEDYQYLSEAKRLIGPRRHVSLPTDNHDEIVFYATSKPGVFMIDCIKTDVLAQAEGEVKQMSELEFETTFEPREDSNAGIKEISGIKRIRQLDRSIGDSIKRLYDFRCQMTGERVGDGYDALVVEAHHIIPFTESMNNDTSNIIILSPTYHRIIHKAKPEWDRNNHSFIYQNGLVEKIKLNKHLN